MKVSVGKLLENWFGKTGVLSFSYDESMASCSLFMLQKEDISCGVMVSKLDKQTYTSEFLSHWVPISYGLVPHLSKKLSKLSLRIIMNWFHRCQAYFTERRQDRVKVFLLSGLRILIIE